MRRIITAITLLALVAVSARAQQMDHAKHMGADSAHTMTSPCPLHLETLSLTPPEQLVVDSLRKEHSAAMKALMPKHDEHAMHAAMKPSDADRAAMENSMKLTLQAVRAVLTEKQRVTFDAAVTAHETEMRSMKESGDHDCMACCEKHGDMHK
jgi:hypothetical protein